MTVYKGDILEEAKKAEARPNYAKRWGAVGLFLAVYVLAPVVVKNYDKLLDVFQPKIYRTGYEGEWKPHVIQLSNDATKQVGQVIAKQGYESSPEFWLHEIKKYNEQRKKGFDVNRVNPGDTVYIPDDMKLE